ncbi:glycosyltransferase family 4 protein [Paludisphaera mucosa]|uniref:MraY family glycosyltransferase n=1 Tax=Paludisphaera mucosa TaxID=3030827 RepID=A0ABT6FHH7_9BACT|nr:MraY family glycosyltransferase [Paludisphaera mucosa]MDG3006994.1 MraY family glycosyltransferase [Paludisphaera mucosa]
MTDDLRLLMTFGSVLAAAAFVLCAGFGGVARRMAPRWGLLDRPGGHKGHAAPVPLGGGVAIWLAVVLVLGACGAVVLLSGDSLPVGVARHANGLRERAGELALILGLATIMMVVGFIDDRVSLSWKPRLAIQVACAAVVAAAGVRVTLFGPFTHPLIGGAVTTLWIVAMTNAFNMLDNMDGLAAGVGLIAAFLFGAAQAAVGGLFAPAVLLILVGALAGFLVHNHAPARLYMGDAGSNFLGFLLGSMTVAGNFFQGGRASPFGVLTPLLVMAVPLYDMTSVILIRLSEGRSPFQPDRRHFSHRLVGRGLTPPQAVWTIDLVTLACGLGALLLHRLDAWGAAVVLAQTGCLLGIVAILELSGTGSGTGTERSLGQSRLETAGSLAAGTGRSPGGVDDPADRP